MENEEEIINQAKTDPEAFGLLYDYYYRPIFGFLYSKTSHTETAKDLTSETFFQALKNFHRYKPQKGASFKSWLFSIAVAQSANYYRRRSKYLEITSAEAPELIAHDDFRPDIAYRIGEDADELKQQIELVRKLMKQLNQKQQTILALRFFSHMTIPEIAVTVHMKEGTVKSHLHRALKRLQSLIVENNQTVFVQTASKQYERVISIQN